MRSSKMRSSLFLMFLSASCCFLLPRLSFAAGTLPRLPFAKVVTGGIYIIFAIIGIAAVAIILLLVAIVLCLRWAFSAQRAQERKRQLVFAWIADVLNTVLLGLTVYATFLGLWLFWLNALPVVFRVYTIKAFAKEAERK